MSYGLRFTVKSNRQLDSLPAWFVDRLELELDRLAESPTELSIPIASPPFPPRGQLYHFECDDECGVGWFFTVIFQYSQDETELHILSITWRELTEE